MKNRDDWLTSNRKLPKSDVMLRLQVCQKQITVKYGVYIPRDVERRVLLSVLSSTVLFSSSIFSSWFSCTTLLLSSRATINLLNKVSVTACEFAIINWLYKYHEWIIIIQLKLTIPLNWLSHMVTNKQQMIADHQSDQTKPPHWESHNLLELNAIVFYRVKLLGVNTNYLTNDDIYCTRRSRVQ